ncbi:hypothetical protein PLESTM_000760200 [Pleodorina starrii]|nr:hypothetical protein PLESTM_000760200 [Pleodorina starrii]
MAQSGNCAPVRELAGPSSEADSLIALHRQKWVAAQLGIPAHILSGRLHLQAQYCASYARCPAKRAAAFRANLLRSATGQSTSSRSIPAEPQASQPALAKARSTSSEDEIFFERIGKEMSPEVPVDASCSDPPSPGSPPLAHPPLRPRSPAEQQQQGQPRHYHFLTHQAQPLQEPPQHQQQQSQRHQHMAAPAPSTAGGGGGSPDAGGTGAGSTNKPSRAPGSHAQAQALQTAESAWEDLLRAAFEYWQHDAAFATTLSGSAAEERAYRAMRAMRGDLAAKADAIDAVNLAEQLAAACPAAAAAAMGGGGNGNGAAAVAVAVAEGRQRRTLFGPLMGLPSLAAAASSLQQQQQQLDLLVSRTSLLIAVHVKLAHPLPSPRQPQQQPNSGDRSSGSSSGSSSGKRKQRKNKQQRQQQQPQRPSGPSEVPAGGGGGSSSSSRNSAVPGGSGGATGTTEQAQQQQEEEEEVVGVEARRLSGRRLQLAAMLADGLLRYAGSAPLLYHELQMLALLVADLQVLTLGSAGGLLRGLPPAGPLAALTSPRGLLHVVRCLSACALRINTSLRKDDPGELLPRITALHTRTLRRAIAAAVAAAAPAPGGSAGTTLTLQQLYEEEVAAQRRHLETVTLAAAEVARKAGVLPYIPVEELVIANELARALPAAVFGGGGGGDAVVVVRLPPGDSPRADEDGAARAGVARALLAATAAVEAPVEAKRPGQLVAVGPHCIHLALSRAAALSAVLTGAAAETEAAAASSSSNGGCGVGGGPLLVTVLSSRQQQRSVAHLASTWRLADESASGRVENGLPCLSESSHASVVALSFTAGGAELGPWMRQALAHSALMRPDTASPSGMAQLREDLVRHLDERHAVVVRCRSPTVLGAVMCMLGEMRLESIRQGMGLVVVPVLPGEAGHQVHIRDRSPGLAQPQQPQGPQGLQQQQGPQQRQQQAQDSGEVGPLPVDPPLCADPGLEADWRLLRRATERLMRAALVTTTATTTATTNAVLAPVSTAAVAVAGSNADGERELHLRPGWRTRQRLEINIATCDLAGLGGWAVHDGGGDEEEGGGGGPQGAFLDGPTGRYLDLDLLVARCGAGQPTALLPVTAPPPPPPPVMAAPQASPESAAARPQSQSRRSGFQLRFW